MRGDEGRRGRGTVRVVSDVLRASGLLIAARGHPAASPLGGDALLRAEAAGQLRRLRRGAYVGVDHWDALDATAQHALVVRAVLSAQPGALVSHRSAAALWGLPVIGRRDEAVHLTVAVGSGGRSTRGVRRHQWAGAVSEGCLDGIRVTSPARTLVDVGRSAGLLAAVVAGDAALRAGLVTVADLDDELAACGTCRGIRTARRAVALMDGRSESPGESLSRVRMAELGLPAPTLQHEVQDAYGFVGRVDFYWPGPRVVGEFDGRAKYGLDGDAGAADRVWNEKLREDRIRATGLAVVRWTWAEAWKGEPMASRLRAAGVR